MRRCWPNFAVVRFHEIRILWWSFNSYLCKRGAGLHSAFSLMRQQSSTHQCSSWEVHLCCCVFMSNSQVIPCILCCSVFFYCLSKTSFWITWKLWWVLVLASSLTGMPRAHWRTAFWLLDNIASLCALRGKLPDNNLQTCRFSLGCDVCCFPFLSDLLCWVMLMFSSHITVFTGVKDCMMAVKQYAVFSWSCGTEELHSGSADGVFPKFLDWSHWQWTILRC